MFLDYGRDKKVRRKGLRRYKFLTLIQMNLKSQSGYILKVGAIS